MALAASWIRPLIPSGLMLVFEKSLKYCASWSVWTGNVSTNSSDHVSGIHIQWHGVPYLSTDFGVEYVQHMLAKTCPFELVGERGGFKYYMLQDVICVVQRV